MYTAEKEKHPDNNYENTLSSKLCNEIVAIFEVHRTLAARLSYNNI
jgi:hypothetical protein